MKEKFREKVTQGKKRRRNESYRGVNITFESQDSSKPVNPKKLLEEIRLLREIPAVMRIRKRH